jgi:hypothetical protein
VAIWVTAIDASGVHLPTTTTVARLFDEVSVLFERRTVRRTIFSRNWQKHMLLLRRRVPLRRDS